MQLTSHSGRSNISVFNYYFSNPNDDSSKNSVKKDTRTLEITFEWCLREIEI